MSVKTMARPVSWTHNREHFYKYMTASAAKSVLQTRTLRWSSPALFNGGRHGEAGCIGCGDHLVVAASAQLRIRFAAVMRSSALL
jgi:hypothetical protein